MELDREDHDRYEQFRADRAGSLKYYEAVEQYRIELLRLIAHEGQAALKSAILINGGGAVALLALIGKIWADGLETAAAQSLANAVGLFAYGVLVAAVAAGGTYLADLLLREAWQKSQNQEKEVNGSEGDNQGKPSRGWYTLGNAISIAVIFLVLASYALFGWGVYESRSAFVEHLSVSSTERAEEAAATLRNEEELQTVKTR